MSHFLNKTSTVVVLLILVIGLVVYFGWKAKKPTTAKTVAELAAEVSEKAAATV